MAKAKVPVDTRDNLQIIQDGISRYGGRQKHNGDWINVQCAFHNDNSPSMGIFLRVGMKRPLGWCSCFSCGHKGPWNEFAKQEGLEEIKEWKSAETSVYNLATKAVEEKLLGTTKALTLESVLKTMDCEEAVPWPESMDWRGYSGAFIRKAGGMIVEDNYADNVAVLFPVYIGKNVRGGVKAVMEAKKGRTSYITMRGEWILKYGLFPYNIAARGARKLGYVILVEGPRDALRLIRAGLPAIAVLGAGTFTKAKANLIRALGAQVYVMSDNDAAGKVMWLKVKEVMAMDAPKRLRLPEERDANGQLVKMDPGNAPIKLIREVKTLLEARHA